MSYALLFSAAIGAGLPPHPGGEFARWQRTIADLAGSEVIGPAHLAVRKFAILILKSAGGQYTWEHR